MKKANKIDALKKLKAEIKRDDYFSGLCYSITILYLFGKKITNGQKRYLMNKKAITVNTRLIRIISNIGVSNNE